MFHPDQPRDDRGRWTATGGEDDAEFQLAQGDHLAGYPVDLRKEEAKGGHTIEEHVRKSPGYLSNGVREELSAAMKKGDLGEGLRAGSFSTLDAATRLVNSTLAQEKSAVDKVASGFLSYGTVRAEFNSVTGYEAYAPNERSQPYIRETYGVSAIILHDPTSEKGFRVLTAFPSNVRR